MAIASPTGAEMVGWTSVLDTMRWAGFVDMEAPDSPAASLLAHLGYAPTDSLGDFGTIPESEFSAEIETWKLEEDRPSLALRNRARRLGHAARVFAGIDWTVAATQAYDKAALDHQRELEWWAAKAASDKSAPSSVAPPPVVAPSPVVRRIGFREVSDTGRADEVPVLDFSQMDEMRKHYKTVTLSRRGPPPRLGAHGRADVHAICTAEGAIRSLHGLRPLGSIRWQNLAKGT